MYTYMYTYVCMYICIGAYTCIHTLYMYMCIHVYIHYYMYTCTCSYQFVVLCTSLDVSVVPISTQDCPCTVHDWLVCVGMAKRILFYKRFICE